MAYSTHKTVATLDENHKVLEVTVSGQAYYVRKINGTKIGPAFDTLAEAVRVLENTPEKTSFSPHQ